MIKYYGIIYKTTNLINGKVYIGQTTRDNLKYNGAGINLVKALEKYGDKNFERINIDYSSDREDLDNKEIFWIKWYRDQGFELYNISHGGRGTGKHSEETKEKLRLARIGTRLSEETLAKMSNAQMGVKNSFYGKHHTKETKNAAAEKSKRNKNRAKLTDKQILEIRRLKRDAPNTTCQEIAERYRMSRSAINHIINRRRYLHVAEER